MQSACQDVGQVMWVVRAGMGFGRIGTEGGSMGG